MDPITAVIIVGVVFLLIGAGGTSFLSCLVSCCFPTAQPTCDAGYQGLCGCDQWQFGCNVGAKVERFAGAIAFAEGYWQKDETINSNSRPARNNNPGDHMGTGDAGTDSAGYAVYSTPAAGWSWLYGQVSLMSRGASQWPEYGLDSTIARMGTRWTTTQQAAWSNNVANFLGGSPSDSLRGWLT